MSRNSDRAKATRERLVEVATRLFTEHGYDGTSTEAVLRESGVSRGALYHHFDSKKALFDAVLEAVDAALMEQAAAEAATLVGDDPRTLLRHACVRWLRLAQQPAVRQIVLIDGPSVVGWPRWRELDERYALGLLKQALAEIATVGGLRVELVDVFAHILLASLGEVALLVARSEARDAALADGEAAVDELLRRLLSGDPA